MLIDKLVICYTFDMSLFGYGFGFTSKARTGPSGPPATIDGQVVWFDADDVSTMSFSGSDVTSWVDKFNGVTLVQEGSTSVPTWSQQTVDGVGEPRGLIKTSGGRRLQALTTLFTARPVEMYLVHIPLSTSSQMVPLYIGSSAVNNLSIDYRNGNTEYCHSSSGGAPVFWGGVTAFYRRRHISHLRETSANSRGHSVNNGAEATNSTNLPAFTAPDRIIVGSTYNTGSYYGLYTGEIGEIIVYDKTLSTEERTTIYDYLLAKWGPVNSYVGYLS
jgi:hypothetical protein